MRSLLSNLHYLILISFAALSVPAAGAVLYSASPNLENPNGVLAAGDYSVADHFTLSADAMAIGGRVWMIESSELSPEPALEYAFFRDADFTADITKPDGGWLRAGKFGSSPYQGELLVQSRVSLGDYTGVDGQEFTIFEYIFWFGTEVPLLAEVPYWLAFNAPEVEDTGDGVGYFWAYSGERYTDPDDGAYITGPLEEGAKPIPLSSISDGRVWYNFPNADLAFQLQGFSSGCCTPTLLAGSAFQPLGASAVADPSNAVSLPSPLLLIVPALLGLARLRLHSAA
jgi:hypothetical protein